MKSCTIHLIEHTHWDREWYRSEASLLASLVRAIDGLLRRRPRTPFLLDGQSILIEDYLHVRPERAGDVAASVARGDLQVGPWTVLPDYFATSAEGLVRNLLAGRRAASSLGGRLDVLYSPDAFGHPAWLPSLAAGFGIDLAVVWRGFSEVGDMVLWAGRDGSVLNTFVLPAEGYEGGAALDPDAPDLATRWQQTAKAALRRASTTHAAVFIGADHHAPLDSMSALRRDLARLSPGCEVRVSRLDEFLRAAVAAQRDSAVVSGEQRWSPSRTWSLQGVHATRLRAKRAQSRAELQLERFAEPLVAMAGMDDGAALLRAAWRPLVENQFHDTAAGTVADDVVRAQYARLERSQSIAGELVQHSLDTLVAHRPADAIGDVKSDSALLIWNPAPRQRRGVAVAAIDVFLADILVGPPEGRRPRRGRARLPVLHDSGGNAVSYQLLSESETIVRRHAPRAYPDADRVRRYSVAFESPPVRGLSLTTLSVSSRGRARTSHATAQASTPRDLDNGTVGLKLRRRGGAFLTDSGYTASITSRVEVQADEGDCYTPWPRGPSEALRASAWEPELPGPFVWTASQAYTSRSGDHLRSTCELRAGERCLRVTYDLDSEATSRQLRVVLTGGKPGAPLLAGTGFSDEWRPGCPAAAGTRESWPGVEPARRHVVFPLENGAYLAVVAPGHLPYDWTSKGELKLFLVRSTALLSRGDIAARVGHAAWPVEVPGAQERGRHRIELGFAVLNAEEVRRPGLIHELWEDAFAGLATAFRRSCGSVETSGGFVELCGEGLTLSAVKPAEDGDGVILRAVNQSPDTVRGRWTMWPPPRVAERVRLDETPDMGAAPRLDGDSVDFDAGPYELVTLRIQQAVSQQLHAGGVRDPSGAEERR